MLAAQDFSTLDPATGQALFERNWVAAPASAAATDGLGPYYNARSCAACHPKGGAGEIVPAFMNLVVDDPQYGALLQLRAITGMKPEARAELTYASVSIDGTQLTQPLLTLSELQHAHAPAVSLRRAPALAGLALLEQVPLATLEARADPDDRDNDGISGRVPLGRYGWKAGIATLREQIARALSLDLGLGSAPLPAAAGDCTQEQHACLEAARAQTGDSLEATDTVLDLLTSYVASLAPPPALSGGGPGAALFHQLGCAACHSPELRVDARTLQPFSDLLLHDLGPGLAAHPQDSEWRTPPLWGLGRQTRFLHDGRAASLEAAVLWHGGEAAASARAYRDLNSTKRAVLHEWLLGL